MVELIAITIKKIAHISIVWIFTFTVCYVFMYEFTDFCQVRADLTKNKLLFFI